MQHSDFVATAQMYLPGSYTSSFSWEVEWFLHRIPKGNPKKNFWPLNVWIYGALLHTRKDFQDR